MISNEEAIEVLKGDFTNIKLAENESYSDVFAKAMNMAKDALEFRSRKPVVMHGCPHCGKTLSIKHNFCPDCGQSLLWERNDNE